MPQERGTATQQKLIEAATALIRQKGYVATSIDDICQQSGLTKGAFFHHFASKEQLVEASLAAWNTMAIAMEEKALANIRDPRRKPLAYMESFTNFLAQPSTVKSCLAGTTVQEAYNTNPALRDAANACFLGAQTRFKALLDEAIRSQSAPANTARRKRAGTATTRGKRVDTTSLAALWVAAVQGSLILFKASQDPAVIRKSLDHVKRYIAGFLGDTPQL